MKILGLTFLVWRDSLVQLSWRRAGLGSGVAVVPLLTLGPGVDICDTIVASLATEMITFLWPAATREEGEAGGTTRGKRISSLLEETSLDSPLGAKP